VSKTPDTNEGADTTEQPGAVAPSGPVTPSDAASPPDAVDPSTVEPADAEAQVPGAEQPAPGLRIVVAEDEALIRLDLAEMLVEAGHEVVGQASDGEQAIALAREHTPDVVVMDIKMPGMDGISAAEVLGREGIAPVVMLTAFSDRTLVERARDAGVMSYVVKPFAAHDVLPALDIARARWQERKALESEVADLGERFETRKRLDRAKGLLMQQLKLSEADAFRWIQKAAMDRRLSMREVADAVIAGMPAKK
jgi:AmiR/NasT family two-component response regulator